jgi:6-pyruvoyltetrahydropterin/6-carboxytetrahydropterin synthase
MTSVTKEVHFYAAHRNAEVGGKCASLHGHRYGLSVTVSQPRTGSVTILFEHLEKEILSVAGELDHSLLLYSEDPAKDDLQRSGACQKVYLVPFETSCENMAEHIAERLYFLGLNVTSLTLRETDTSSATVTP